VRCDACARDNPPAARFCNACGQALAVVRVCDVLLEKRSAFDQRRVICAQRDDLVRFDIPRTEPP